MINAPIVGHTFHAPPHLHKVVVVLLCLAGLVGCNFDKDINVVVPDQASQLAVECYIEPGQPIRLLLTETRNFFDAPSQPFINNATVRMAVNGQSFAVPFSPLADTVALKVWNYVLPTIPTSDTSQVFTLQVSDTAERRITSVCRMPVPAMIDSLYYRFRGDSMAAVVCILKRPTTARAHFYRVLVGKRSADFGAIRDLLADDAITAGDRLPVSTDFNFRLGDTLVVRVLHVERDYYDFLSTSRQAQNVAGNPFAQPAPVRSNIAGGFGIFTAFQPVERRLIIR